MLHPSYHDLMSTVNREVEKGETPIVNSRYSIVLATSKRARQLIDGVEPLAKANCQIGRASCRERVYPLV